MKGKCDKTLGVSRNAICNSCIHIIFKPSINFILCLKCTDPKPVVQFAIELLKRSKNLGLLKKALLSNSHTKKCRSLCYVAQIKDVD